jgi:outer membrane murein-binding lipoprotein Lpp
MRLVDKPLARLPVVAAILLGGLSLSACATKGYVNDRIAEVNTRIDQVNAKADSAMQTAQAANSAAQAAAADAQRANQRLDQLGPRVDTLEQQRQAAARTPRG